jgi:hypothetical protein
MDGGNRNAVLGAYIETPASLSNKFFRIGPLHHTPDLSRLHAMGGMQGGTLSRCFPGLCSESQNLPAFEKRSRVSRTIRPVAQVAEADVQSASMEGVPFLEAVVMGRERRKVPTRVRTAKPRGNAWGGAASRSKSRFGMKRTCIPGKNRKSILLSLWGRVLLSVSR